MAMQLLVRSEATVEGKHHCSKCGKSFDEPELVTYHACPHCHIK
jgi:DNA-directed RNA polymerase subunit RPC12/RpoP